MIARLVMLGSLFVVPGPHAPDARRLACDDERLPLTFVNSFRFDLAGPNRTRKSMRSFC